MARQDLFNLIEYDDERKSRGSSLYDAFMLLMIVLSIVPLAFREPNALFLWFDKVSVIAFITDYLLRWSTADLKLKCRHRWMAFFVYPFTPMAIVDLLSILPSLGVFSKAFKMFRVARLLKILRVFKFMRYSRHIQILVNVLRKERYVLLTVLGISLFYILVTALVMFNVEMGKVKDGEVVFATFFDAIYWATTTLTTVGYGDIYPVSGFGRVVGMISSLFGVAIIALPSGIITASYLEELREWKKNRKEEE